MVIIRTRAIEVSIQAVSPELIGEAGAVAACEPRQWRRRPPSSRRGRVLGQRRGGDGKQR